MEQHYEGGWRPEVELVGQEVPISKINEWMNLDHDREIEILDLRISEVLKRWRACMLVIRDCMGKGSISVETLIRELEKGEGGDAELFSSVEAAVDVEEELFEAVETRDLFCSCVGLAMSMTRQHKNKKGALPSTTQPRKLVVPKVQRDVLWVDGCPPLATMQYLMSLGRALREKNCDKLVFFLPLETGIEWHVEVDEEGAGEGPLIELVVTSPWRVDRWAVQKVPPPLCSLNLLYDSLPLTVIVRCCSHYVIAAVCYLF